VREVHRRGERSDIGARGCVCGLNGRRHVQDERKLRGQRCEFRDHERMLVRGSARFVVMPVHDQLDSLSVMHIRPIVIVTVAGDMRGDADGHRPREN